MLAHTLLDLHCDGNHPEKYFVCHRPTKYRIQETNNYVTLKLPKLSKVSRRLITPSRLNRFQEDVSCQMVFYIDRRRQKKAQSVVLEYIRSTIFMDCQFAPAAGHHGYKRMLNRICPRYFLVRNEKVRQ